MSEELLFQQFSSYQHQSGGEIYLPISTGKDFVLACSRLKFAVIGLEFFYVNVKSIMPNLQLGILDNSYILKGKEEWPEIVKKCNEIAYSILLRTEKEDESSFYNVTLLSFQEWKADF